MVLRSADHVMTSWYAESASPRIPSKCARPFPIFEGGVWERDYSKELIIIRSVSGKGSSIPHVPHRTSGAGVGDIYRQAGGMEKVTPNSQVCVQLTYIRMNGP